MNPIKTTETKTVSYWACSCASHRHTTKAIAFACIKKNAAKKQNVVWTPSLKRSIFICVLEGNSLAQAASIAKVSRTRVRDVINKMRRQMACRITDPLPDSYSPYLSDMRNAKDFWLRQLNTFFPSERSNVQQEP